MNAISLFTQMLALNQTAFSTNQTRLPLNGAETTQTTYGMEILSTIKLLTTQLIA
jgi:hypothetical protein